MGKGWKLKLPDALWAYRTTYKTPIGMSPYQLVYEKTCHLPVELEHRAHYAIRKWNIDLKLAGEYRRRQISELEEWRDRAYHSASIYKERTKRWHDKRLKPRNFNPREKGITFQFQSQVVWSWKATKQMAGTIPSHRHIIHGAITIQDDDSNAYKVNGQRLKLFLDHNKALDEEIDVIDLVDHVFISN
jgi:hypothetical protein